jgi:hypothetical protein
MVDSQDMDFFADKLYENLEGESSEDSDNEEEDMD